MIDQDLRMREKNADRLFFVLVLVSFGFAIAFFVSGCATEIRINGNNNKVDTSPAKWAGYGSTVDVLKGMSLPSLSLGGSKENGTNETDETNATKVAEAPVTETEEKNVPSVAAVVETPEVTVTEDKVVVKEQATEASKEDPDPASK